MESFDLLEYVKGLVLQILRCTISMTQGNTRIAKRSSHEDPVLVNIAEARSLELDSLQ